MQDKDENRNSGGPSEDCFSDWSLERYNAFTQALIRFDSKKRIDCNNLCVQEIGFINLVNSAQTRIRFRLNNSVSAILFDAVLVELDEARTRGVQIVGYFSKDIPNSKLVQELSALCEQKDRLPLEQEYMEDVCLVDEKRILTFNGKRGIFCANILDDEELMKLRPLKISKNKRLQKEAVRVIGFVLTK